jgi:hypothetical protein
LGGVERVFYLEDYRRPESKDLLSLASIEVIHHTPSQFTADARPDRPA